MTQIRTLSSPPGTAMKCGGCLARANAQQQAGQQEAGEEGKRELTCSKHSTVEYKGFFGKAQEGGASPHFRRGQ